MKILPSILHRLALGALFAGLSIGQCPKAVAWTATISSGPPYNFTGTDLPSGSYGQWVYLPNYTPGNPPPLYFCMEVMNFAAGSTVWTTPTATYMTPSNGFTSTYPLGTLKPVSGQPNTQTFSNPSNLPPGFQIFAPANHTAVQFLTGYRLYGKIQGSGVTGTAYVTLGWGATNGGLKLTISDTPLRQDWEPDVVAAPITNSWGEPTLTFNGLSSTANNDRFNISAPIPASYTVGWNVPATVPPIPPVTFSVSGGTGNGLINQTTGTSKTFGNVAESAQTYVLKTQGPAQISWKLSTSAKWEIFRGSTQIASGDGTSALTNITQTGTYSLQVNGIKRTAEDEIVTVTPGFLSRSKTMIVIIGSP